MNDQLMRRYEAWIGAAEINPDRVERVDAALKRALHNRSRIEPIASSIGVPWQLLAALQELEAGGRMDRHPANGDSLHHRTVNEPKGLPRHSDPPFTWESVAREEYAELAKPEDGRWTLVDMCYAAERFNGMGYFKRSRNSPYVLAGTTLESPGKYTSDHVWDADALSDQVGALALWLAMIEAGIEVP